MTEARFAAMEKRIAQLEQIIVRMSAQARGPKGDKGDPGERGRDGKVIYEKAPPTSEPEFRIPVRWRTEQKTDGTCVHTPEY